uniref:EGF-like domain protein n=1 Tax=Haemonchus contortus TaxID=6289 RepID=A0A7I4YKL2_HAECO
MRLSFSTVLLIGVIAFSRAAENDTVVNLLRGDENDINETTTEAPATFSRAVRKMLRENSEAIENNSIQEVRKELDRAVSGLNNTVTENSEKVTNAIADIAGTLDVCTAVDCNNRGTCLGTKKTHICACVLGYTGRNCEDAMCDSARDCNGRGICFGTTNSLTCLCNLGYRGKRCEKNV